jgi:predicted nucleotidyltransferase
LRGVEVTFLDLERILSRLTERAHQLLASRSTVLEVSLFGSLVRGNYSPGSDADLLIILSNDPRRFIDRIPEFLEYFSGLGLPIDVFPYTAEEIDSMRHTGLVKTALAERRVLARRS